MNGTTLNNDMTLLLNKLERRMGLTPLIPHLPEGIQKSDWANVIMSDTIVEFSRYFPNRLKMVINDTTCYKKKENNVMWYYIKDEVLQGLQMAADFASLYNRGIYIDFEYPNRFALKGLGNVNYDLSSFIVVLLVEHMSLATISPTKMTLFEDLAMADVAMLFVHLAMFVDSRRSCFVVG